MILLVVVTEDGVFKGQEICLDLYGVFSR